MLKGLDRGIGEVLQTLKDNDLEENTIVIFTSDNGGPGYLGLPDINKPYRGWKISYFKGGIRVPYFIKWPGQIPVGRQIRFQESIPGAKGQPHITIKGAGHFLQEQAPKELAEATIALIRDNP